ncbi:DUF397 domain-containing protein [Streptomyces nigrescens]|uniref:DUF397 domain-containing protein n=1 Tax=Streptomyces nigrescens TaxID=1920 RepID=A0ABY7J5Q9_STRNI|nr:DUF397 domain-containing protein [Streptomyces nigrescens]WAU06533.1 DUF397 domain-containing protein [Streptomyces nigrescens]
MRTAVWRKSSYTNGDGGNCLEVAEGFPGAARWRKSTYSNGDGGNCVQVVDDLPGIVPVRDSKDPHGPAIVFPAAAWTSFISAVKDTDLPSV